MVMKRHGAWQFHRAINSESAKRFGSFKWWNEGDELEKAHRAYSCISSPAMLWGRREDPYRLSDQLTRCAYRFIRRFNYPRTVKSWNDVINIIGARRCYHRATLNSARIDLSDGRPKSLVIFTSEFLTPKTKFPLLEVKSRLKRIQELHKEFGRIKAFKKMLEATEEKRLIDLQKSISNEAEQQQIAGNFCLLSSAKYPCFICGCPTNHEVMIDGIAVNRSRATNSSICMHNRCQAIKKAFPSVDRTRKYYSFPLICVLTEIIKNDKSDDNNENFRGLEKHFIHNIRQIHKWRDRCNRSKDRGKNSRQLA